jgi:GNAT superfamily N-acetyltransferase
MVAGQVIVALLKTEDTAAVRELLVAGLKERWGTYDPRLNTDIESFPQSYEDSFVLVAKRANIVVGTGTLRPTGPNRAEVVRMSVASSSRRIGTGSLILSHLLQLAWEHSVQEISLETTSSWSSAVSFYTRHGFIKTHEQGDDSYFVYKPGAANLDDHTYSCHLPKR